MANYCEHVSIFACTESKYVLKCPSTSGDCDTFFFYINNQNSSRSRFLEEIRASLLRWWYENPQSEAFLGTANWAASWLCMSMHHLPTVTYCHYLAHVWQRWNPIAITVCLLSFIVYSLSSSFFSLSLSLYFFAGISSSETAFFSYPVTSPNNQSVYFYTGCSLLSFCALLSPSHYSLTGSRWLSHLELLLMEISPC